MGRVTSWSRHGIEIMCTEVAALDARADPKVFHGRALTAVEIGSTRNRAEVGATRLGPLDNVR